MTRILIVDDDEALLLALPRTITLRLPDCAVDIAASGRAALGLIEQREYDVVVVDLKMPEMDGVELIATLHAQHPETPTLFVSGHSTREIMIRALKKGAFACLEKPIDRDLFMAYLERALHLRALRRERDEQRSMLAALREEKYRHGAWKEDRGGPEHRSAQAAAEEFPQVLTSLLNGFEDCALVLDLQGRIVWLNSAAARQFRWALEQVCGKPLQDVTAAVVTESGEEPLRHIAAGTPWKARMTVLVEGRPVVARLAASAVVDPEHGPSGALLICRTQSRGRTCA